MKFENMKVYNFFDAIRGMRNSWESWDRIDSTYSEPQDANVEGFEFGPNDWKLAKTLAEAGTDHGKYMRQILVSVDIVGPEYWWKEFDTYKVGTVVNSTSMMHKLGEHEITPELFQFDELDEDVWEYMNLFRRVVDKWQAAGKRKNSSCPHWRKMNQLTAIGFLYRRTVTMNYQVLRSMYHSRRKHRLSEWHEFCAWCETLPYADLITGGES